MYRFRKVLFVALFVSLLMAWGACSPQKRGDASAAGSGGNPRELVVSTGEEPAKGFNPAFNWPFMGEPLFQSKLFVFDTEGNILSHVATGYTVSDDSLEYIITMRDDIVFSDGKPLTAWDVIFTIETVAKTTTYLRFDMIKSMEALDDHTVKFTLVQPFSPFIHDIAKVGIMPAHAYSADYGQNPIGSGPYTLAQWDKGQQFIVEPNPSYFGKKSNFDKISFLVLNNDAAFAAVQRGEIDVAKLDISYARQKVPGYRIVKLDSMDGVVISMPYVPYGTYEVNGLKRGNNVTSDNAIRQALSYAINRQEIVDGAMDGYGLPIYSNNPFTKWDNPANKIQDGDPEKARQILKEGGWADSDGDGIVEKNGLKAEFGLYYSPGRSEREIVALAVQQYAKEIGVKINLVALAWDEIRSRGLVWTEAYIFGKGFDSPVDLHNNYSSSLVLVGQTNSPMYGEAHTDEYLRQALSAATLEETYEYMQKVQWDGEKGVCSLGACPFIPVVSVSHLYFVRDGVDIGEQHRPATHWGRSWAVTENLLDWTKL
jgi:peptide/nickel transport system substrate-binding protein